MSVQLLDALCRSEGALPSAMLVAAHPDDGVLGAGSRLPRLESPLLVHTTDGAPADLRDAHAAGCSSRGEYARLRRAELLAALEVCGLGGERTRPIDLPDQQASYHLADLSKVLAGIILEAASAIVLTHAYEGGHPDHDSTAFAVSAACRVLERDRRPSPVIIEFAGYHGYHGYHEGRFETGDFLPDDSAPQVRTVVLSAEELDLKRRMLACYGSQRRVLELLAPPVERFRLAPRYSFLVPPHPGTLLYERFPWGMTGRLWRSLAADALRELGLDAPCP